MKASDIHNALTLLPNDLVLATDRLRTGLKPKRILWKRLAPIAACLVVLLSAAMVVYRLPVLGGGIKLESAAEAPAAAAPMAPAQMESAADTAVSQDAPAADVEIPAEEEYVNESHRHSFAEDITAESGTTVGCGNTQAVITMDGQVYTIAGGDAITLSRLLENLPYDPALVCRCKAEFTVDTELLDDIEVSLDNAFARCERGQASLTQAQGNTIREVVDRLG